MRYRPSDLARLGPAAREQIRLAALAGEMQAELAKANKFGAVRAELDGYHFDSKAERDRYAELHRLHRAGVITDLVVHPRFRFEVAGVLIGHYTADFEYWRDGRQVVEDVKSKPTRTTAYRLRVKLLKALHGIEITEVMT